MTPACFAAFTASSALSFVSANGFSQKMCFLAAAAAITCRACIECGVARTTASTFGFASRASYDIGQREFLRVGERLLAPASSCASYRRRSGSRHSILLNGFDQGFPPPAEADNGGIDHVFVLRALPPTSSVEAKTRDRSERDAPAKAKLLLDDVDAQHQRHHFVERMAAAHAFAAHAAVRGENQPFGRDHASARAGPSAAT